MQKQNLVVFDIDGTLTNTVEMHHLAFKKALNLIGVDNFNDKFGSYKHHTDSYIAKVIYEQEMNSSFDKSIIERFESYLYESIVANPITEIAGSKDIISYLENETDFGVCYATGSMYRPAKLKLQKIGIDFHPLQLVASNDIEEREQIVEMAIRNGKTHYNVEKFGRIISFGDGLWDLTTANNLFIEFVGIGNANKELLLTNGMKKHFPNFNNVTIKDL